MKYRRSYFKILLSVIISSLALLSCQNTSQLPLNNASFETIITEGFGLSEEDFFKKFTAEGYENWEKEDGEEYDNSSNSSLLTYTLYTVPEPVDFSGLSCTMTLKFYDEQGLGMISYTANNDLNAGALYNQMMSCYQTVSDTFGEPETEDMQWDRYASSQAFWDDVEAGGGYSYSETIRMQNARWNISTRIDGDPYDQFAVLQVIFDWPVEETASTSWMFSITRDVTDYSE